MLPILHKYPVTRTDRRDPFRLVRDMFEDFGNVELVSTRSIGAIDLYEDEKNLYVEVELPGYQQDHLDLTLEDGALHISAERHEQTKTKETNYYLQERVQGKWARSIRLPIPVQEDKVQAAFKDGVLNVTLEKQEQAKSRKIKIG